MLPKHVRLPKTLFNQGPRCPFKNVPIFFKLGANILRLFFCVVQREVPDFRARDSNLHKPNEKLERDP